MHLFNQVCHFLNQEKFEYEIVETQHDDHFALRLPVLGKNGDWLCVVRVIESATRIIVYSIYPQLLDKPLRHQACITLNQINYGLLLGNFEIDLEDGEIRYKTTLDINANDLSQNTTMNLLFGNFYEIDTYYPAIEAMVKNDPYFESIIKKIEQPNTSLEEIPADLFGLVDSKIH